MLLASTWTPLMPTIISNNAGRKGQGMGNNLTCSSLNSLIPSSLQHFSVESKVQTSIKISLKNLVNFVTHKLAVVFETSNM